MIDFILTKPLRRARFQLRFLAGRLAFYSYPALMIYEVVLT